MMLRFRIALLFSFASWAFVFFWLGARADPFWRGYRLGGGGGPEDYYNLLVEGFLKHQVSLNADVDPGFLSPDSAVRARAPYKLDAALYKGRYFLYYGVTPAVLVLLPYTALSHQEMGLEVACLIVVLFGFGMSVVWLDRLQVWRESNWGPGFAIVAVSVMAVVPGTLFLVRRSSFYDLPIATGYACICCFWFALFNFWRLGRPVIWTCVASAAYGLAVGCRPNLIFVGPLFLALVVLRTRAARVPLLPCMISAIVPAFLIGSCLGWYNWARFGNPLDFGFTHGVSAFFSNGNALFSSRFIGANLSWYLLTPPILAPRFPFDFPIASRHAPAHYSNLEAMNGFLPVTLLAGTILVFFLLARRQEPTRPERSLGVFGMMVMAAAIIEVVFTCAWGFRAYRYATDFLTPLAFLLVLGVAGFWTWQGWRSLASKTAICSLLVLASGHVVLGAIQLFDAFANERPLEFATWSRLLSPEQSTMERLGAAPPGPLAMSVRFARPKDSVVVPILTTGIPSAYDSVRAAVYPNGYISLEIYHGGFGGPRTGLIPVVWGKPYTIQLSMGSLFPEKLDQYYHGWRPASVDRVKALGWVSVDGKTVLERQMIFFPGTPGSRLIGDQSCAPVSSLCTRVVSVDSVTRDTRSPALTLSPPPDPPALFTLHLQLAAAKDRGKMPLLCSGVTGSGNLLFLDPLPSGRYHVAVDQWGIGLLNGPEFGSIGARSMTLQIMMGPELKSDPAASQLLGANEIEALKDRLLVWIDGELVGNFRLAYHLDTVLPLVIGRNDAGFSSASSDCGGDLQEDPMTTDDRKAILAKALRE
jgi:hypothetical protein